MSLRLSKELMKERNKALKVTVGIIVIQNWCWAVNSKVPGNKAIKKTKLNYDTVDYKRPMIKANMFAVNHPPLITPI